MAIRAPDGANKQKEYYQHKIPYTISDFGNLNVKFFGAESPTYFAHYLDGIDRRSFVTSWMAGYIY